MRSTPFSLSLGAHLAAGTALVVLPALSPHAIPEPATTGPLAPLTIPPVLRVVPPPPLARAGTAATARASASRRPPASIPPPTAAPPFVAPVRVQPLDEDFDEMLTGWDWGALPAGSGTAGPSAQIPGGLPTGAPGGGGGERTVKVGGEVVEPRRLAGDSPAYPRVARSAGVEGVVVLECTIDRDGAVQSVSAVSGHPLLVPAAVEAVRSWRYTPTRLNGVPVAVQMTVTVRFQLNR